METCTRYVRRTEITDLGITGHVDGRRSLIAERIMRTLMTARPTTAADLASALRVGRSTATRALAQLETQGKVVREPGGHRPDGPRQPDTWTIVPVIPDPPQARLPRGAIGQLILSWLSEHPGPHPVGAIAAGIGDRSKGAVANALTRNVKDGHVRALRGHPARYAIRVKM